MRWSACNRKAFTGFRASRRRYGSATDCLPAELPPPRETCGRLAARLPEEPILDAASLPTGLDLFRVGNFSTVVVGTERFMDAVRRMESPGIVLRELPAR